MYGAISEFESTFSDVLFLLKFTFHSPVRGASSEQKHISVRKNQTSKNNFDFCKLKRVTVPMIRPILGSETLTLVKIIHRKTLFQVCFINPDERS